MSTACHRLTDPADFADPNVVKVVCDKSGYALYFSRAPIPWPRDAGPSQPASAFRHIGLYGYRAGFVGRYLAWEPCPLEQIESLEQLRVLWHGERIAVCLAQEAPPLGVDTPQDLERVRAILATGRR
jgi:3-deoxy-manno-octulosonate cytidylyltransferase (CMP-KDO synthetase)